MYTYYEIWATNSDNEPELMSGSYDRSDCVAAIEADRDSLREQGYTKLRIDIYLHRDGLTEKGEE